ncbi:MAG: single-stranded-DNA-specific exonuclease RecJ [Emergencia sp.]|jgi:single-stranded-DNA-specific exonuclease|uniref:Single-stranded-DNA-specific exonuclease RecJ n=1 Tax=Anaerotruncus colihominis TaxID=169435 RepID=A0A845QI29_9FIRM|nr:MULTISPECIES: single-stranded-DNA-specific exonuclease RecJ [Eubacteriales]MCI9476055.1 single-stranded-DNA-specific exonuclease RecJ [Emergencia sp.]MCI9639083.1 single-stranded-DNA-specific exonuclease RecJ [Emergencia sp.]NBH60423.1 single-stranded-DNA-specific exonuclease RecJ [Anaerotruncus colihominis]NCF01077.1 single-stranded-DNA-specific exonuclease RecJ [Anaerotruncus sp. 80]
MNLQPRIYELLHKRGIETEADIEEFLSDKPQKTYDPFLLLNMEAGVDLILSSIEEDEKICIYGDYDADGITSTAVLMEVLSNLTSNLAYYIPSRFEEGYGLNCGALDKIKAAGIDLVITVDCGSVSCAEVEHAKEIGLKILVTDHHTITDKVADCLVINPMQPGCPYPFKHLAGVGVAFKLAQAIAAETGLPKSAVNRTLDLVGVGTIGDIVPLVDENRTLAKYGIRSLNLTQRPGLSKLIEGTSLQRGKIKSENISYVIVPHLNASGRMQDAKIAASLMMEKDSEKVKEGVETLISCNQQRKKIQSETFEQCCNIVEEKYQTAPFLVIDLEDAHEGITGIVAGKLKEIYHRPAVIVTPTAGDCLKGTGRGIEGIDLYSLLKDNEELFERFGGHAAACGFTMKKQHLDTLRSRLNESMGRILADNPELADAHIQADLKLEAGDVNLQLVAELKMLEPFGCENPQPLVSIRLRPGSIRKMGNQNQYTKFIGVLDDGREIQCVIFKEAKSYDELLKKGQPLTVTGNLESQTWNGKQYLQITVQAIEE